MKLCKLIILRLKSYFRKPTLLIALAGFLVVLWAILNFTKADTRETFVLPIGVVDLDQTSYSDLILSRVAKKESISIKTRTMDEGLKQVRTGKLEAVYILKEGLMDKILADDLADIIEVIKSPVSLSAEIVGELFAAEVMRLSSNADAADAVLKQDKDKNIDNRDKLWQEAWDLTDGYWEPSPIITIDYRSTATNAPSNSKNIEITEIKDKVSEILLLSLMTFSILIGSSSLLAEKNNGLIKRIISTGTSLWIYLLSSVLTLVVIHALGLLVIMAFTNQLHGLMGKLTLYMVYMLWAGALGLLMVAFTKKMQQVLITIPFITLLNSLLLWKVQVYNNLASHLLVLTLLTVVMLLIATKSFKNKFF